MPNFSKIRDYLSKDTDVTIPRHIFILAGDDSWHIAAVTEMLHGHESQVLWLDKEDGIHEVETNNIPESFPKTSART